MNNDYIIKKFEKNGYTVSKGINKIWTVRRGNINFGSSTNLTELYGFLKHRLAL